jgi:superfamily I DNA/RNA helicase/RecB family exonuclease
MIEAVEVPEIRLVPDAWGENLTPPGLPQMIVGGPGTGKTEFLCRRIATAVSNGADPASLVALTFSRRSVNDIRTRLFTSIGSASYRVQVATYHSLANRLVEKHHAALGWSAPPVVLAGPEHERFVLSILEQEDPNEWRTSYRPILATPAMATEVTDFILRFHEQTMTIGDLERSSIPEWEGLGGFLHRYNEQLLATGRIDYGRLLNEAVIALETDPQLAENYAHVLADEYQDTSHVQARLLFALARPSRSLTVAGDPYQSIYSFRGADLDNVLNFPSKASAALDSPTERLVLTTSFRVPETIIDAAVAVTGRVLPGAAGKVDTIRKGGTVATHVFDNQDAESEWIAKDIERLHLVDGVALPRIAVFTRSGGDFQQRIAAALERRAIPHTLTLEQLEDQPIVRFVHDLIAAASTTDADEQADIVRSLLLGPFIEAATGTVNEVARHVNRGSTWADAIRSRVPVGHGLAGLIEDHQWATAESAETGLWHLWTNLPQLHNVAVDDAFVADRRAWAAFAQAVRRFGSRIPHATLRDQQILASASDIEADPLFSFRSMRTAGVMIGTLHGAKGTEYDVVYIANAVEGSLPDLRAKDSLLKTRLLNPHLPEDPAEYVQFRLSEERRLAYTAMTRATDKAVWTATVVDSPAEQVEPSRFLRQVGEPSEPAVEARPLTRRGFEAALRRSAYNPSASAVERLAALSVLGSGPDHGLAEPDHRYGVLEPGSDNGFVPADVRMSPSRASTYDECPRRFAFERFASHRDRSTPNMTFGILFHKVLELAEAEAIAAGERRSSLERALQLLDQVFDEYDLGPQAVAAAWKRRAVIGLEQLYSMWPGEGEPVRAEISLDVELGGTQWNGKVDRIERASAGLKVVDYKTSKQAARVADAAESLQLGFYILAALEDAELTQDEDVIAAEFWYPVAKPLKSGISRRSFDLAKLDDVKARLIEIALAVTEEDFPPTPNANCDRCDYQPVCPAQKEGREAFSR